MKPSYEELQQKYEKLLEENNLLKGQNKQILLQNQSLQKELRIHTGLIKVTAEKQEDSGENYTYCD